MVDSEPAKAPCCTKQDSLKSKLHQHDRTAPTPTNAGTATRDRARHREPRDLRVALTPRPAPMRRVGTERQHKEKHNESTWPAKVSSIRHLDRRRAMWRARRVRAGRQCSPATILPR